jgi:hypothetical protein
MSRLSDILNSLKTAPGYTLMRSVGRFSTVRRAVAVSRSTLQAKQLDSHLVEYEKKMHETIFPDVDKDKFVTELREQGIAYGLNLPAATVKEIRAYADLTLTYADRDPKLGFMFSQHEQAQFRIGKPILISQYFNSASECTAINQLLNDPLLRWIACKYLESVPTFVGANLWWTYPVNASDEDRNKHAHLYHRDLDDFRFFKFFFYLTDVGQGDGAHVAVVASHREPPILKNGDRWNIRRYSDSEILGYYPIERIHEICGKAGTGFAENTLCIHKGRTPTSSPRLLLQLQFALFNYGVMHDQRELSGLKQIS